jgi:hypothetical protein
VNKQRSNVLAHPISEGRARHLAEGGGVNLEGGGRRATLLQGMHSFKESVTLVVGVEEAEEGGHGLRRLQVRNCVQSSLLSLQIRNCIRSSGK